jgi:hypothetical protein
VRVFLHRTLLFTFWGSELQFTLSNEGRRHSGRGTAIPGCAPDPLAINNAQVRMPVPREASHQSPFPTSAILWSGHSANSYRKVPLP